MSDMENLDTGTEPVTPAPAPDVTPPAEPVTPPAEPNTPAQIWPTNWRELMAGNDAKELARLQRFTDPAPVWQSFRNLETKMSSGKFKPELGENPTPEELSAYRKAYNIPEAADGYLKSIPDGYVIGDEDRPAFEKLAEKLHAKHASPEIFNAVLETTMEMIEQNQKEAFDYQIQLKEQSRHKLYETWGPAEFKMNTNAINNLLKSMPESLRERFEGAQLADGNLMFNDVEAVQWWAQHVREMNPAMGVMPAGQGDVVKAVDDEISEMKREMADPSKWFAKTNNERRARYTQLIETRDKLKARG